MKDKKQPTPQEQAQTFLKEYKALCKKSGYQINVNPAFQARDDGTWSVVLQTSVGLLPEPQSELTK